MDDYNIFIATTTKMSFYIVTGLTEVRRMTRITMMVRVTGMTRVTRVSRMTGMTGVTRVSS